MTPAGPLDPDTLRRACDPAALVFETTAEVPDIEDGTGQERAATAARFGFGIRAEGYNLFATGPAGTGKLTMVRGLLERSAAAGAVPPDVCYVFDFRHPHRPRALRLPAGRGAALRDDLRRLVDDLRAAIPAAFEGEELAARKKIIEDEIKERHDRAFEELRAESERHGIAFLRTPLGFAFAAMRDGEVLTPDAFAQLPEAERTRLAAEIPKFEERLRRVVAGVQAGAKEERDRIRALLRDVASAAADHLLDATRTRWADLPGVLEHLDAIRADVIDNFENLLRGGAGAEAQAALGELHDLAAPGPAAVRRYLANLLVDNSETTGAPVVFEGHPTHQNLVGRTEHHAVMGALVTDFHLIRAGALHRANGGYLVLDARSVLMQPYAWDALKRALRSREVRIESLGQILGFVSTVSLEPEPVPLDVKVVLLGERTLCHLLEQIDPEFRPLFKVVLDFEDDLPRTTASETAYARLVATTARRDGLLPFRREAVARVIERASRAAGDAERLSAHMGGLSDLLRESDHAARTARRDAVQPADVDAAVAAAEARAGRVKDRMAEEIRRGTVLLDVAGAKVGQVNGLSVVQAGASAFGRPARITARVRLGRGEVLDIEREVELSGPIHAKGVLILSGFLAARYALDHPLSLAATLVFEQSYGPVEGDSASCAELCALLSAVAEIPLRQSLAVTGSVNQYGEVQPVGGVDEKIEGFFDACRARGAADDAGVIIPETNARRLMLRDDVVAAARAGRFRVHAIRTVDDAMELLTGLPAGARDTAGRFPEGSVNARVEARLVAMATRRQQLAAESSPKGTA